MDSNLQGDSVNLERNCRYQSICEFGKNVNEYPEDCVFYRQYRMTELELLIKEQCGTIGDREKKYLKELSGFVEQ